MKIRNGFVSNSSSSSYIIILPENYEIDPTDERLEGLMEEYETDIDSVKNKLAELKSRNHIWSDYGDDWGAYEVLVDLLRDYVIHSVEVGPDGGSIELANVEKIKELLK